MKSGYATVFEQQGGWGIQTDRQQTPLNTPALVVQPAANGRGATWLNVM